MKPYIAIALIAAAAGTLSAQVQDTRPNPFCVLPQFNPTTTGPSPQFDNRQGCTYWVLNYSATGFTALSIQVESAPGANSPGTWVAFAGTVDTGSNPSTSITQTSATMHEYYPWMRINLTSITGTGQVRAQLFGYKTNPNPSGTSTIVGDVTVIGPDAPGAASTQNPVQVAGNDGLDVRAIKTDALGNSLVAGVTQTGTAVYACPTQALFNLTGSGNTQIIAASGATTIRICHISLNSDTSEDIKITRGTGANCGTGTADVTGLYKNVTGFALDFTPQALLKGAASGAICINQSAVAITGGVVIYAQY
jgi:hypothetical protein